MGLFGQMVRRVLQICPKDYNWISRPMLVLMSGVSIMTNICLFCTQKIKPFPPLILLLEKSGVPPLALFWYPALIDASKILSICIFNRVICGFLLFFPFFIFKACSKELFLKASLIYCAYVKHQWWLVETGDQKTMKHFWNHDRKWLSLAADLLILTTLFFLHF